MKYRRYFQMILVAVTGILLVGCKVQTGEQKEKKQDTQQESTTQIYKTSGTVSQGIERWWFKRNEEHRQPEVSDKIDLSKYAPKNTHKRVSKITHKKSLKQTHKKTSKVFRQFFDALFYVFFMLFSSSFFHTLFCAFLDALFSAFF